MALPGKTQFILFLGLTAFFLRPARVLAAPQINSVTTNASSYSGGQVPAYAKFEVSFQITGTAATNFQLPYESSTSIPSPLFLRCF